MGKRKAESRRKISDLDAKDYITRLPNDIVCHIISLLPFQCAVQTASLSTPWKDMWKKALSAVVQDASLEDVVIAINKHIDKPSEGKNWGSQFNFGDGRVLSVVIPPNSTLLLDFSLGGNQELPLPFDWLLIPEPYIFFPYPPPPPPTPGKIKLKSLRLKSVSSLTKDVVSSILSSLPFLRSLTIEKCNGLESLLIYASQLERLIVLDCPQLRLLRCRGSYLGSFRYRGRFVPLECKLCVGYKLDAMLDFRQGLAYNCSNISAYDFNFIISISSLGYLTLCRWFCESFILPFGTIMKGAANINFLVKELWWIECSMERENLYVLLSFLKQCLCLQRLYVTIDPKSYNMTRTKRISASLPRILLTNLKLLKLEGFPNEREEIAFARQLIPFCKKRPEIIAKSSGGTCLRHLVEIPELEKYGECPYRFIVLKNKACPDDHIHMK